MSEGIQIIQPRGSNGKPFRQEDGEVAGTLKGAYPKNHLAAWINDAIKVGA